MEKNNIIAAPQVANTAKLYEIWRRNHVGSVSTFYAFLTTPTVERDEFLSENNPATKFSGSVVTETVEL